MSNQIDFSIGRDRITSRWGTSKAVLGQGKLGHRPPSPVVELTTGMEFLSASVAADWFDLPITKVQQGIRAKALVSGKYQFAYIDGMAKKTSVSVLCVETGKVFRTIQEAEKMNNLGNGTIKSSWRYKRKAKGLTFVRLDNES